MDDRIAVFGAYGHTARFVIAELRRRGWAPILSGRDRQRLEEVAAAHPGADVRHASAEDASSLDRALAGAQAVINCAGPFGDTAPPLLEAALRGDLHYLDTSAESLVTVDTFARGEQRARERGLVVAPSIGFFGALGDLLATSALGDWPGADEIVIAVVLDSWQPTRGTRAAAKRRAGRRIVWSEGELAIRARDHPPPTTRMSFPPPFGEQDMIGELSTADAVTIPRHIAARNIHAYLNRAPIADLSDPGTPGPAAADDSGRSAQRFIVEVTVRRGHQERRRTAAGRDIYAVSAPIAVEAVERIVQGRVKRSGAAALGELFDADDFLAALSDHLSIERG